MSGMTTTARGTFAVTVEPRDAELDGAVAPPAPDDRATAAGGCPLPGRLLAGRPAEVVTGPPLALGDRSRRRTPGAVGAGDPADGGQRGDLPVPGHGELRGDAVPVEG